MELEIWRYNSDQNSTLGIMFAKYPTTREKLCVTCEDGHREIKEMGATRIPAGRYEIKLRTEGRMAARYAEIFPDHLGMLWLQNVPGFEWIYLHIGNDEDDTLGCILVGTGTKEIERKVWNSQICYKRIYKRLQNAVVSGGLWITIYDFDRPILPSPVLSGVHFRG